MEKSEVLSMVKEAKIAAAEKEREAELKRNREIANQINSIINKCYLANRKERRKILKNIQPKKVKDYVLMRVTAMLKKQKEEGRY